MSIVAGTQLGSYEVVAQIGTDRAGFSNFDLHPDGKRFAVLKAPGTEQAAAVNKVSFIFNFFDEIRRKVPTGTK